MVSVEGVLQGKIQFFSVPELGVTPFFPQSHGFLVHAAGRCLGIAKTEKIWIYSRKGKFGVMLTKISANTIFLWNLSIDSIPRRESRELSQWCPLGVLRSWGTKIECSKTHCTCAFFEISNFCTPGAEWQLPCKYWEDTRHFLTRH